MILGYEAPVDIPVQSIYDKPMMQMYINALQKDYEQGIAEQKEFLSNFGNFMSPIAADVDEWNKSTINPIQEFLAQNPNALRSVEGRAALSRFIATRPYGDLAKLRQSAENAKAYQKAIAEMKRNGTYSKELEDYLGVGDVNNWNTLQNGIWNTLSPTEYKDLNKLTSHWFDNLEDSYLYSKDGFDYYGITDKQMDPIIDSYMSGLLQSDLGKFHLQRAGGDQNVFRSNIKSANNERLRSNRKENPYSMENVKYQHDMAQEHQKQINDVINGVLTGAVSPSDAIAAYPELKNKLKNVTGVVDGSGSGSGKGSGEDPKLSASSVDMYYYTTLQKAFGPDSKYTASYIANNYNEGGIAANLAKKQRSIVKNTKNGDDALYKMSVESRWNDGMFSIVAGQKEKTVKGLSGMIPITSSNRTNIYSMREARNKNRVWGNFGSGEISKSRENIGKASYMRHAKRSLPYVGKDGRIHVDEWVKLYDGNGKYLGEALYNTEIKSVQDNGVRGLGYRHGRAGRVSSDADAYDYELTHKEYGAGSEVKAEPESAAK